MGVILETGTNWDDPPSILIYNLYIILYIYIHIQYTNISARVDQLLILGSGSSHLSIFQGIPQMAAFFHQPGLMI